MVDGGGVNKDHKFLVDERGGTMVGGRKRGFQLRLWCSLDWYLFSFLKR